MALHALADERRSVPHGEGVEVVPMGGITNTRAFASRYGPRGLGLPLAGLYDAPAEATLRHGLVAAGLGAAPEPDGLPTLGFFACSVDLEDELIRALGVEAVEAVIEEAGEGRSIRLLANMPAQRGWTRQAVLRRFLGPVRVARPAMRRCWSGRCDPAACPSRWRPCSPMYDPAETTHARRALTQRSAIPAATPQRHRRSAVPARGLPAQTGSGLATLPPVMR